MIRGGLISLVFFMICSSKTRAQFFIDPVTPDIPAGCISNVVVNTGTSAFDDLQVVVVDGTSPSIIFVDYSISPPTEFCFPLMASSLGGTVFDPDVVWDYSGSGLLLVVYESNLMGSQGVWSEMWDWNGGSPSPVGGYGTAGFCQFRPNAVYPNVDADIIGNAVVVWDNGGDIESMTVDFPTQNPSGNIAWLNFGAPCTLNSSMQPDVAIRYEQGDSFVDFVMVDRGTTSGEVVVVFEKFTNVQMGVITCKTYTVQHAGNVIPTAVRKPRIDMPTYWSSPIAFKNVFSCSVLYELIDGARHYTASSQLQDVAGASFPVMFPPPSNVVFEQTYSPPAFPNYEWISEILNKSINPILTPAGFPFDQQLLPPSIDLESYVNSGPVTSFAGDGITYAAWNWNNTGFSPTRNSPEVLSRRLMLQWDGNVTITPFPPPLDTEYRHVIPVPTTSRYFAVGEGYNISEPQTLVSMDGTLDWVYYAFTAPVSGRIYYKRSIQNPVTPVRTIGPTAITADVHQEIHELNVYPNPGKGAIILETISHLEEIRVLNSDGRMVYFKRVENLELEKQLDLSFLQTGFYTLILTDTDGRFSYKKLIISK